MTSCIVGLRMSLKHIFMVPKVFEPLKIDCIVFFVNLSELQKEVDEVDTQLKIKQEELHILNNYKVRLLGMFHLFNKVRYFD